MGHYCIVAENLLHRFHIFLPALILNRLKIEDNISICIHEMCRGCGAIKLENDFDPIKRYLVTKFRRNVMNLVKENTYL